METVTKFRAIDGIEFSTETECRKYEELIVAVDKVMAILYPTPKNDGCSFANGGGYIKQEIGLVVAARVGLLGLCKRYTTHEWIQRAIDFPSEIHMSYPGKIIDELNLRPLNAAWYRIMCIDAYGREWGQPYFANNLGRGENVCLNPK